MEVRVFYPQRKKDTVIINIRTVLTVASFTRDLSTFEVAFSRLMSTNDFMPTGPNVVGVLAFKTTFLQHYTQLC